MFSENLLLVFKDRKTVTINNDFWTDKLKTGYNVSQYFLNDKLNLTNKKIIVNINEVIKEKKINVILFEGDHAHIIDYDFIKRIDKKVKKGIFLGDDMVWHYLNVVTAQSCDFVFSSCPISALKFQEIGINSFFVPIECNGKILKDYKLKKIYDVLHFGRKKTIRMDYINFLKKNNINIKLVSPYDDEADDFNKLSKLINQAKIVLNFSESSNGDRNFNPLRIFKSFYQLKGRIQMSGLCNSLCISQFSPANSMMYNDDELPSFKTKEECLGLINFYLKNEDRLKETTNIFNKKSLVYEDSIYITKIQEFINQIEIKDKEIFFEPIWYSIIYINQSLRLRFKKTFIFTFFEEFFDLIFQNKQKKILNKFYYFFLSFIFLIRYCPFLFLRFIFRYNKKK
jgi:hypothetical protein